MESNVLERKKVKPFNRVQKKSSGSFRNVIYKMCFEIKKISWH